jgi:hypothetical protein
VDHWHLAGGKKTDQPVRGCVPELQRERAGLISKANERAIKRRYFFFGFFGFLISS